MQFDVILLYSTYAYISYLKISISLDAQHRTLILRFLVSLLQLIKFVPFLKLNLYMQ